MYRAGAGLAAADAFGMMSALNPSLRGFSPAWGLVSTAAPSLCYNLVTCPALTRKAGESTSACNSVDSSVGPWGVFPSSDIARELFIAVGPNAIRPSTSRSKAIVHVPFLGIGRLLGMAARGCDSLKVAASLKELGISSNKANGVWTGVSMARYQKLYSGLHEALNADRDNSPAIAMLLRYVWERAESRADIVAFIRGVGEGSGEAAPFADGWTADTFVAAPASAKGLAFREHLLSGSVPSIRRGSAFMDSDLELVAAKLGRACAVKPPVKMGKRTPVGVSAATKPVTDCVEVAVREITEYCAIDIIRSGGLPGLCHGALPALLAKAGLIDATVVCKAYEDAGLCLPTPEDLAVSDERTVATAWFDTLQELGRKHGAAFLSRDESSGVSYELWPSLQNVTLMTACLLDPSSPPRSWETLEELLRPRWNVAVGFTTRRYRGPNDTKDFRTTEVVTLQSPSQRVSIEVSFEVLHHMARVTHTAPPIAWMELKQRLKTDEVFHGPMSWLFEAALAPEQRLTDASIAARVGCHTNSTAAIQAVLWSRRRSAGDFWRPLDDQEHVAEGDYQQNRDELKAAGLRSVAALQVLAPIHGELAEQLAGWIARDAPQDGFTDEQALGAALARFPSLREAIASERNSPLVRGDVTLAVALRSPISAMRAIFAPR